MKILARSFVVALGFLLACTPSKADIVKKYKKEIRSEKNPIILMKTSMGDMVIELYADAAPKTVQNFLDLALGKKEFVDPKTGKKVKRPFYNGLTFHRVIPNFMIQGGDPKGDGTGGPGYRFEDEISAKALGLDKQTLGENMRYYQRDIQQYLFKKFNIHSQKDLNAKRAILMKELDKMKNMTVAELLSANGYNFQNELPSVPVGKYTLAMANAGPNTNGSQFFINITDNFYLNGKHTVFGKVLEGKDIPAKIAAVDKDERNKPKKPVYIKEIVLLK
ncbi:MAG: peptidylprolyl isomerase [Candidatus Hydrogenedentota bacterium]|nr:MAG: peptidylprolyl isomerase [Candidatus Hydrogenedentota bacterium]